MNKKILVLLVLIIVVLVVGVIVGVNVFRNDEETSQGQTNDENQVNSQEESQVTSDDNENAVAGNNEDSKILVLYFSQSGNTEAVANFIHEVVGGDIIKLETEQVYPSDYDELVDYAQEEQRQNARPTLSTTIDNIDEYDTIFLGFPNWWGDMPMAIYTFLDNYDLSGKTIAPFITHGGSGLSGTPQNIQEEEPNATVTEGLAVSGSSARNSQSVVNEWLVELGF